MLMEFVYGLPDHGLVVIGLAFGLLVAAAFLTVVIGLFRAERKDAVDVIEAGANWLPWRPRRRNRR
ncbi:hypothetical protein ACWC10_03325 [Streptomyces sp. NPDC001595]|uniref:hypothetical protein n=1 Tax=Streptomyces sp. NPDC001532 TaxID=3154520 RepID=UPI00331CD840